MRAPNTTRALAIFCIVLVSKSVAEMEDKGSMGFSRAKPRLRSSPSHHRVLSTPGRKSEVKASLHLLSELRSCFDAAT